LNLPERSAFSVKQPRIVHKARILWILVAIAIVYGGLLHFRHSLTGHEVVDGILGVLLGLYICSHPAANAIDLLFYDRAALRQLSSNWNGLRWFALNLLVFLCGWVVIFLGTTRLVERIP
jgi:hypothetical protein